MAKEYIEREALKPLEEMEYIYFMSPAAVPYYEADKVWEVLDNLPAADVVEVVRCRDCWKSADGLCGYHLKNVPGKDFCGDGERRTDDG